MITAWLRRVRQRLSGEGLPLALLRGLVILASFSWLVFAPPALERPGPVTAALTAFAGYSVVLYVLLWIRPEALLRWNPLVLLVDVAFALTIIQMTGGAGSVFFLAFYLISAVQSYYYGMGQGIVVALGTSLLYLGVIWPTLDAAHWADYALRGGMLLLTAVGLGVLGNVEREERREVLALNEELRVREGFVQDVVGSIRDGVVVLDRDRRVTGWNRAMEDRYGLAAAEVLGRPLFEVFPSLTGEGLAEALERVYAGLEDGLALDRVQHRTPRAGLAVLNVRGHAIHGAGRTLRGVILFLEDVTRRVALEESLRHSEKLAGLGTLAAGLAHEINNPIGVITSRAELMLEDLEALGLPAQVGEDLAVIRSHAHRIARITQGLLSFARHRPGEKVPVDLNRVVEDTMLLAAKQVQQEGITLRVRLKPGLPPVVGDPTLLGQVLLHLLNNARDAVAGGGQITVRTEAGPARSGSVRLVVHDTGVGIPKEQLGRIFEPFFTTKPAGTGLGLAMCYGIVQEHDGEIGVESQPGLGTTFVLSLPGIDRAGRKVEA